MILRVVSLLFFATVSLAQTGTSPCATLPGSIPMPTVSKLPDPFTFLNGTRVTTRDQWACRREEIRALVQRFELGPMPPKPSSVTGTLSGGTLTVKVTDRGKSISFTASIKTPTSGKAPYPAIIAYGDGSIPIPANVATISYNNFDVGADLDRGKGKFYDIYGSSNSAGAMVAWAWGASRIIDALETLPNANIDTTKIGITGCSRNGKGALVGGSSLSAYTS